MADVGHGMIGVIGIGNVLLKDEGLGVHAVRELEKDARPEGVMIIDGGTDPWPALSAAAGCRMLLILDAVAGGKAPGELHRLSLDEVETADAIMSLHGVTLFHLLKYEKLTGNHFDEVYVLGMEPEAVAPAMELSECCRRRLPAYLDMVRCEIAEAEKRLNGHSGGR